MDDSAGSSSGSARPGGVGPGDARRDRQRQDAPESLGTSSGFTLRAPGVSTPGQSPLSPRPSLTGSGVGGRSTLRTRPSERSRAETPRRFFSTDDDEDEVERDLDREYQEGYFDGLRDRRRRQASRVGLDSPQISAADVEPEPTDAHHGRHARFEEPERDGEDADEGEEADDNASIASDETFTLRERQAAINETHPFGIRIWKPAIYKKTRSVERNAEEDIHSIPGKAVSATVWIGNGLWTAVFGIILFTTCVIAFVCMRACFWVKSARDYSNVFWSLGRYLLFPFGNYVELRLHENYLHEDLGEGLSFAEYERWQAGDVEFGGLFFDPQRRANTGSSSHHNQSDAGDEEDSPLLDANGTGRPRRLFGRGKWTFGRVLFYLWFYVVLSPILYTIALVCWIGVFSVPMARVLSILASSLRRHPLAIHFRPASAYVPGSQTEDSTILLCTYRAFGMNYYKYTVDGQNIILLNLMVFVFFAIFDYFVLFEYLGFRGGVSSLGIMFFLGLLSVIPLAYFIGQAVASISAQSSMGMGATINAFFSTVVEVYLYCIALNQGKGDIVEGSIVGSVFAGVLLMPGLSMCAGAVRRKTQRYNPRSAGVSSTMLVFAVIGVFAPTIFYQIYGPYELHCDSTCDAVGIAPGYCPCRFHQVPLLANDFYFQVIRPFCLTCALLLFVSYIIGLWFTLRTHAAMIWSTPTSTQLHHQPSTIQNLVTDQPAQAPVMAGELPPPSIDALQSDGLAKSRNASVAAEPRKEVVPAEEAGGHDAPNWGRTKSTIILLGATVLYAIIAEILVDTVDVVVQNVSISQKMLGLTIFALVPNTTEFLNAISFAINGNVALSMEIGSAYVLQVCLLQTPALVLYSMLSSAKLQGPIHDFAFTLIFPHWDLWMVVFCVFLFSYIYAEGKSNYFKGAILLLTYVVVLTGFYFADHPLIQGFSSTPWLQQHSAPSVVHQAP